VNRLSLDPRARDPQRISDLTIKEGSHSQQISGAILSMAQPQPIEKTLNAQIT